MTAGPRGFMAGALGAATAAGRIRVEQLGRPHGHGCTKPRLRPAWLQGRVRGRIAGRPLRATRCDAPPGPPTMATGGTPRRRPRLLPGTGTARGMDGSAPERPPIRQGLRVARYWGGGPLVSWPPSRRFRRACECSPVDGSPHLGRFRLRFPVITRPARRRGHAAMRVRIMRRWGTHDAWPIRAGSPRPPCRRSPAWDPPRAASSPRPAGCVR